jgi:non-canonical (house-cleaning) NTP pyrophosphatase
MLIAIASQRKPKIDAVKRVFQAVHHLLAIKSEEATFLTYEIGGGPSMPRTMDELLGGAKRRVESLQQVHSSAHQQADYYIVMEGGLHSLRESGKKLVFLQSWAYVSNGKRGCFGSSGNVLVPDSIAQEVMNKNRELSDVIDEVVQMNDVRGNQGTWGILTKDMLNRQQSFELALIAAFAPFYNGELYGVAQTS